jgi:hypothetical protein
MLLGIMGNVGWDIYIGAGGGRWSEGDPGMGEGFAGFGKAIYRTRRVRADYQLTGQNRFFFFFFFNLKPRRQEPETKVRKKGKKKHHRLGSTFLLHGEIRRARYDTIE